MHEKDIWLLAFALSAVGVVCWLEWRVAHVALRFVWRDAELRSSYTGLRIFADNYRHTALGTMRGRAAPTSAWIIVTKDAGFLLRMDDTRLT